MDLATPHPEVFAPPLLPEMDIQLCRAYTAMAGMVFGEVPERETIIKTIRQCEEQINEGEKR